MDKEDSITIAFTGHRPSNKNTGGYDVTSYKNKLISFIAYDIILNTVLINDKYRKINFIVGGALGFDQLMFDVCFLLKQLSYQLGIAVNIEIAIPYKNQPLKWFNTKDIERYYDQLRVADTVTLVDTIKEYDRDKRVAYGEHSPYKLQIRNEYMCDKADIVISLWDGSPGGTRNCIKYANKIGIKPININPSKI